jgi:hypothetical protein
MQLTDWQRLIDARNPWRLGIIPGRRRSSDVRIARRVKSGIPDRF